VALLRPIPVERSLIPTRPVLESDFSGAVGRSRIEDHDFATVSKRAEHAAEIFLGVLGDQNR
jgi:hypothetical protein